MTFSANESLVGIPSTTAMRPGDFRRFLAAATVVAVLDISFAATWWVVFRHATTFTRVLQSIASGLLGRAAFEGGAGTALLGAGLHCVVAAGWTAIFLLAARNWAAFARLLRMPHGALKTGAPFGMMVWLVMNFVVVPLSHATPAPVMSTWFWASLLWHAVGVGFPIALIVRE